MPISVSDTDPPDSGKLTDHVSVGVLTRIVSRSVVDEVLAETGRVQKRTRSLPAHVVVYFVLALALFADGYEEVIRKLVHGLRFVRVWSREWVVPSTGALSQARQRLGPQPLQALFDRVAVPLARPGTPGAWLRSWRLMAIDGVMIDLPDTEALIHSRPWNDRDDVHRHTFLWIEGYYNRRRRHSTLEY